MTIDPIVYVAFVVGVAFGFVLDTLLRWVTDARFRLARWAHHRRAVHGGR